MNSHLSTTLLALCAATMLAGCQETLRPGMTAVGGGIGSGSNMPPVNVPVPIAAPAQSQPGSLWVPGSKQFFKDSRAHQLGDIITVLVAENASAKVSGNTSSARSHSQKAGLLNFLNLEGKLITRGIPLASDDLVNTTSARSFSGNGTTNRSDSLTASVAAVVTQVLPNGLLVIQGQREVMVNYEKQTMSLQGFIRPEDISAQNTISSDKIAEARIAYAGKGTVDENQTPQYGVRWIDKILPF